jgi:hypothetical protein
MAGCRLVTTDRERRLALNEAAFRVANERMRDWPERQGGEAPERFYCECAAIACHEHVLLTGRAYESVRADSSRFVVLPGHEIPDIETVVERHEGYLVIEKNEPARPVAEATDPRG